MNLITNYKTQDQTAFSQLAALSLAQKEFRYPNLVKFSQEQVLMFVSVDFRSRWPWKGILLEIAFVSTHPGLRVHHLQQFSIPLQEQKIHLHLLSAYRNSQGTKSRRCIASQHHPSLDYATQNPCSMGVLIQYMI